MPFPAAPAVPELDTAQMVEVDRIMTDDLGISLIQMMENAGRALALVARDRFLDGDPRGRAVQVLAGRGGNGGGALVAARRLAGWGAEVRVGLASPPAAYGGVPRHQLAILERLGLPLGAPGQADVVVDGLIGYSLRGPPRGVAAQLIRWTKAQSAPVLSLDVPSGLDATTAIAHDPHVSAEATLTLALPKRGLSHVAVGELYLADIRCPPPCTPSLASRSTLPCSHRPTWSACAERQMQRSCISERGCPPPWPSSPCCRGPSSRASSPRAARGGPGSTA